MQSVFLLYLTSLAQHCYKFTNNVIVLFTFFTLLDSLERINQNIFIYFAVYGLLAYAYNAAIDFFVC